MEVLREIRNIQDTKILLEVPESFVDSQVEILILRIDKNADHKTQSSGKKRSPSSRLKGTRIKGDIQSPVIPETDWNVLK